MCGIVGMLGRHEAWPILLDSLRRLEYRGYDSAGIATLNDAGILDSRRALGKLVNLSDALVRAPLPGSAGIGHTRWATHGAPSVENAHPHRAGRVAVVHNGIIENFRDLRAWLAGEGVDYTTETDTETVALLCNHFLEKGLSPLEAVRATLARLEGAFALCFLFEGEGDLMIAARKGSPLAVGWGKDEMFVGSDALALAPVTDRITYLEEGDHAVLTRAGATIYDAEGKLANRAMRQVDTDATLADKGHHRHFMAKEIAEQPARIADLIGQYMAHDGTIRLPEGMPDLAGVERVVMVACGTAHYACAVARYWFEQLAGIPVDIDIASEFRYREPPIGANTLALFVSQSGETADTLAALRYCRGRAAHIVAVVNVDESSIARESDLVLPIMAGTEIGVASTKAFTCQLGVLALLALATAHRRGKLDDAGLAAHLRDFRALPAQMAQALDLDAAIQPIARRLARAEDVLFLGRGAMFPLAMEGALKLKEISYIHAEGYAAGELKHGPIALVDRAVPVVVLAPHDRLFDKIISNMQEVMAREGRILLLTDAAGNAAAGDTWRQLVLPQAAALFAPILYAVPIQLLAYHTALAKGTDVDQPRNLAKSVTVE